MTRLFKNNVTSELAVAIDATATEIQILDPSSFPTTIPGSQVFTITLEQRASALNEICRCTAINGDKLTIVRGQEGTTPLAFQAFDLVESRLTAEPLTEFLVDAPVDDVQYVRRNGTWSASIAVAEVSVSAPAVPIPGQLWWESDSGSLNIWYVDPNTNQWVQTNANGIPDALANGTTYARKDNAWVATVTAVDINNGLGLKVNKAGDTMTGNLTVSMANPGVLLNKAASGQTAALYGQKSGVLRWAIHLGENSAESSGNAGSHFAVQRFNDGGSVIDNPLTINRTTGQAYFPVRPDFAGYVPFDTANFNPATKANVAGQAFTGDISVNKASPLYGFYSAGVKNARLIMDGSGNLLWQDSGGTVHFYITPGGAIYSQQMGDMYNWIESRANAHAVAQANAVADRVHRVQMSGYGESYDMGYVTDGPNVVTDCFFGGFSTQRHWRTLQMNLPSQGGWFNIWVS